MNGRKAVKLVQERSFDLVLMDHMMPEMDGMESVAAIRALGGRFTELPIVAQTANVVSGMREIFLANSFNDFLAKPIATADLDALLQRWIPAAKRHGPPTDMLVAPEDAAEAALARKAVTDDGAFRPHVDERVAKSFIRDAEKAAATLEAIHTNQYRRDDDMQMFVITVHALKSAFANISEPELAALAYNLEQAGRRQDISVISAETPVLLEGLRAVIEKITPTDEGSETVVEEDRAYLREKLLAMQAACATYDSKVVKDAMAELRQKAWSRQTREQLDIIAEHLLHSEFEEVAGFVERLCPGCRK